MNYLRIINRAKMSDKQHHLAEVLQGCATRVHSGEKNTIDGQEYRTDAIKDAAAAVSEIWPCYYEISRIDMLSEYNHPSKYMRTTITISTCLLTTP